MDEHHGLGLAAEGVLEQLGELGVAEGNVLGIARGQCGHDVPQSGEAAVDVLGLLQPLPCRLALAHPLAACCTPPDLHTQHACGCTPVRNVWSVCQASG